MFSLYDFNGLTDNEKAEATWQGTFLADRFEGNFAVQLYNVSNFYVEVFYDRDTNAITGFRSLRTKRLLAPYLDQIKLV